MPPTVSSLTFGRCTGCLGAASMRGEQWWHDPGRACGLPNAQFSPVPPFDPFGSSWSISDPQAVLDDLPDMHGPIAHSAGRELLRRYERPLSEVGVVDLATLLAYAERIRHGDEDDDVSFTDPVVSSDYAPDNDDAGDVAGTEDGEWSAQPLVQRSSGRRPRSSTTLLPVPSQPASTDDDEEDYGPASLTP
jgi:hypothetical protein